MLYYSILQQLFKFIPRYRFEKRQKRPLGTAAASFVRISRLQPISQQPSCGEFRTAGSFAMPMGPAVSLGGKPGPLLESVGKIQLIAIPELIGYLFDRKERRLKKPAGPFVPFFMQSIGVPQTELPFWVALFGGTPSLAALVFSPFWGMMANRFGCKKMLLRCYIGGVVVLCGIALCSSPHWMIVFRLLQGVVCGSLPVALTLASSLVPKERVGFALGMVNSATFSGLLFGSFFGGISADLFAYRTAFLMSGIPTALSVVIMAFGVKEYFTPPAKEKTIGNPFRAQWKKMTLSHWQLMLVFPILLIAFIVMFGSRDYRRN